MSSGKTDNSLARVTTPNEKAALEELRNLVKSDERLSCPLDDVYLLRFLRNKKMDTKRAFAAVQNFWNDRHRFSEAHDGLYPSVYEEFYQKQYSITFANRDKLGRQIILWRINQWDPKALPFLDVFRSNFPIVDTITSRQETQLNGAVFIIDLNGLSMSQVTALTPSTMKMLWNLNDGFPLQIKEIHLINHPAIFNLVYTCSKPFMKEKLKRRVRFHGYDYNSLHKCVDPEILPECYGGRLSFEDFQEKDFIRTVLGREQYYRDLFNVHGYGHLRKTTN